MPWYSWPPPGFLSRTLGTSERLSKKLRHTDQSQHDEDERFGATHHLKGKMSGGLGRALARRLVNGESFFQSVAWIKRSGIRENVSWISLRSIRATCLLCIGSR
jgi:hypothetical protein